MRYFLAWFGLLTALFTISFSTMAERAIALRLQSENTEKHSADAVTWLHQGMVLARLNLHIAAVRLYDQALQLIPNHSLALVQRCASLNQLRRYEEAMIDCERALQENEAWETTGPAYAWSQRSYSLIGLEQYGEAIASAERAIQLDSTYADAWNNQAVSLWRVGNYEAAAASIAHAIELNPHNLRAQFNQGRILSSIQQYDAAIQSYCQAIRSTALYCTNLVISTQNQNPDQSQTQDTPDGLTSSPTDIEFNSEWIDPSIQADVLVNLGATLWYAQRFKSALEATQEAVRLNPQSFAGWHNQGVMLAALGQSEAALASYEHAGRLSPNSICALVDTLRIQHPNSEQPYFSHVCLSPEEIPVQSVPEIPGQYPIEAPSY